jgi:hypothetical protein
VRCGHPARRGSRVDHATRPPSARGPAGHHLSPGVRRTVRHRRTVGPRRVPRCLDGHRHPPNASRARRCSYPASPRHLTTDHRLIREPLRLHPEPSQAHRGLDRPCSAAHAARNVTGCPPPTHRTPRSTRTPRCLLGEASARVRGGHGCEGSSPRGDAPTSGNSTRVRAVARPARRDLSWARGPRGRRGGILRVGSGVRAQAGSVISAGAAVRVGRGGGRVGARAHLGPAAHGRARAVIVWRVVTTRGCAASRAGVS